MNESPDQDDAAIRRLLKESEIEETPELLDGLRRLRAFGALPATDPTGELAALLAEPGVPVRPLPLEPKSARPKSQRHRGLILSFALAAAMGAGASGVAASSDMRLAGGAPDSSRGSDTQVSDAQVYDAEVHEQAMAPEEAEPEQDMLPPAAEEYSPVGTAAPEAVSAGSADTADAVPVGADGSGGAGRQTAAPPADAGQGSAAVPAPGAAAPPAAGAAPTPPIPQVPRSLPPEPTSQAGCGEHDGGWAGGGGRHRADDHARGSTASDGYGSHRAGFPGIAGR